MIALIRIKDKHERERADFEAEIKELEEIRQQSQDQLETERKDHGECRHSLQENIKAAGQCFYPFGVAGDLCRVDPCRINPCLNGGTCASEGQTFKCLCRGFFSGEKCEVWKLYAIQ